jgi:pyruvate/2-oxoglutarate dehydrogenase complex dihydrolipoamide acyltransferase (E2) component
VTTDPKEETEAVREVTSHHGRLYALALGLVVFFLAWAVVAARPWATAAPDPRMRALAVRQAQLQREAKLVRQVVAARWAKYRVELKARQAQIARVKAANAAAAHAAAVAAAPVASTAAAGPVQVVNLPPAHVVTRTS